MMPSVGRIVHYRPPDETLNLNDSVKGQPYPAIITHVWGESCVNLFVFNDGSFPLRVTAHRTSVSLGEDPETGQPKPGCWCWPPLGVVRGSVTPNPSAAAPGSSPPPSSASSEPCTAAVRDRADVQPEPDDTAGTSSTDTVTG